MLKKYDLLAQQHAAVAETASENLMSRKPLEVSNVGDYNLWDSVQYFLDNSVKEGDEAYAPGTKIITTFDINLLKNKTERCIGWANDPHRQAIEGAEDMTDDEAAAIMLYTQETVLYKELNSSLRTLDEVGLSALLPYLKILLRALHKLPLVHMQVFRGIKVDLSDTYNGISEPFVWWAFSSTTLDRQVLETPMYLGKDGPRTLFM